MQRTRPVQSWHARALIVALVLSALAGASGSHAQQSPSASALKEQAREIVGSMGKMSQVMVDSIFSFGELGFQEFETAEYVTGILRDEGFEIGPVAPACPPAT